MNGVQLEESNTAANELIKVDLQNPIKAIQHQLSNGYFILNITMFAFAFNTMCTMPLLLPIIDKLSNDHEYFVEHKGLMLQVLVIAGYAAAAVGAIVFGRIADHKGRKVALCLSMFGMGISLLFYALSMSYLHIFLARLVGGFFDNIALISKASLVRYYAISITKPDPIITTINPMLNNVSVHVG